MNDELSIKDRVIRTYNNHPEWTAKEIAAHLGVERHHVYNNARAAGLTLASAPFPAHRELTVAGPTAPPPAAIPSHDALDITVFATKPHEMAAAQLAMIDWATSKVAEVRAELSDAQASLEIAVSSGWRIEALERIVNKAARMVTFYEKIKVALEAGYYIVPPFPIDIFTIRTDRKNPNKKLSTSRWERHLQAARMLPVGAGRYVSDSPTVYQRTFPAYGTGKNEGERTEYWAEQFRDVAFPFGMAKPQVMEATAAAMAMKVFDQLGVLPGTRKPDPIICGQILKPGNYRPTPVTFFVAWWLDTKTL